MEHLATYSTSNLKDFCSRLKIILDIPDFVYDYENETEWGESKKGNLTINVSKPFEIGTLQEWDDTVPDKCNFGISMTKENIDLNEIRRIGQLIADEFRTSVYYHRTWIELGKNIKREIEIKTSYNTM